MSPKISELTADDSIGGGEVVPCTDSTTSKKITINQIKDYTIDQIEGTSAATDVDGEDGVFILKDGVLRPVDIDKVAQHAIDTIWGKGAEASPDSLDKLPLKDATPRRRLPWAPCTPTLRPRSKRRSSTSLPSPTAAGRSRTPTTCWSRRGHPARGGGSRSQTSMPRSIPRSRTMSIAWVRRPRLTETYSTL